MAPDKDFGGGGSGVLVPPCGQRLHPAATTVVHNCTIFMTQRQQSYSTNDCPHPPALEIQLSLPCKVPIFEKKKKSVFLSSAKMHHFQNKKGINMELKDAKCLQVFP